MFDGFLDDDGTARRFTPCREKQAEVVYIERMKFLVEHDIDRSVRHTAARTAAEYLVPGKNFEAVARNRKPSCGRGAVCDRRRDGISNMGPSVWTQYAGSRGVRSLTPHLGFWAGRQGCRTMGCRPTRPDGRYVVMRRADSNARSAAERRRPNTYPPVTHSAGREHPDLQSVGLVRQTAIVPLHRKARGPSGVHRRRPPIL
jgi:hypothetical protein